MDRRSFLISSAAAGSGLALGGGVFWQWQELAAQVHYPGRLEGHYLRDQKNLPAPSKTIHTDVLILGSGVAGLTAAWKMHKLGKRDFLMLDGPQPYGNAAGGAFGEYAYPTGGHYLPLPSPESTHVREILSDLGIILRDGDKEAPYYDERFVLHAPEERLLRDGMWEEGFLPTAGLPEWELAEHKRFFAEVEHLRQLRGKDGRRVFVFPTMLSSSDPQWAGLDLITLKQWMEQGGYRSPSLHWYLNYCCRDDYGRRYDEISAWAGLHYYCSRWGKAANAGNGAWLTWPGGMSPVASAMDKAAGQQRMAGTAYRLQLHPDGGVEALCFSLENGQPRTWRIRARKAICAMPLYVAARIIPHIAQLGFDLKRDAPSYAPWMVANFLMQQFPAELPAVPLSWDNVVYDEPGLGFVVSTHQDIRVRPPEKSVFSCYVALSHLKIDEARKWLNQATSAELLELAVRDLKTAYGWKLAPCVERVDITVRGHAMAAPLPGFRSNAGCRALREETGPILFAHADLSGFSVFEEAAWWGYRAAGLV